MYCIFSFITITDCFITKYNLLVSTNKSHDLLFQGKKENLDMLIYEKKIIYSYK